MLGASHVSKLDSRLNRIWNARRSRGILAVVLVVPVVQPQNQGLANVVSRDASILAFDLGHLLPAVFAESLAGGDRLRGVFLQCDALCVGPEHVLAEFLPLVFRQVIALNRMRDGRLVN